MVRPRIVPVGDSKCHSGFWRIGRTQPKESKRND
jgi:hypothetical protein